MGAGVTSSLLMFPHDSVVDKVTAKYRCSSMGGRWGPGVELGRGHGMNQQVPRFALLGTRA